MDSTTDIGEQLNNEIDAKFNLVKLYKEMQDNPSARDMLAEILKEGDAQQQVQAQEMLDELNS